MRALLVQIHKSIDRAVILPDTGQTSLNHLPGGDLSRPDGSGSLHGAFHDLSLLRALNNLADLNIGSMVLYIGSNHFIT
jgi:hypothetical protein